MRPRGLAVACRDGDASCDLDGTADGTCTVEVVLCADHAACGGVPIVRGAGRAAVTQALAALPPDAGALACTAGTRMGVALAGNARRRLRLTASVAGRGRARLRVLCTAASGSRPARAVVVTTDFETGGLATVGVARPHRTAAFDAPVYSDAVVRVDGDRVFVVNRLGGDWISALDPRRGFRTLLECSTGAGSNPHDVAVVAPGKAYVTRYNRSELWIVDPTPSPSCAGFRRGTIDLSPWADADGLPEMDQVLVVGDRAFVLLERLDRGNGYLPVGKSILLVIDTTTDRVVGSIRLAGANAFSASPGMRREPGTGAILVSSAGNIHRTGDGGIERIDPATLTTGGFFATEDGLGGNVTDFVVVSATKGYAIVLDDALQNRLVAFDPRTGGLTRRVYASPQYLSSVVAAPDGMIWLTDRALTGAGPGIRIFDPATDRQTTRAPIAVGLPPFSIGFLP